MTDCPKCGQPAIRMHTLFGLREEHCEMWSWGGKPLASAETHEARKAAHAAFDPLWSGGVMSRASAYQALSDVLGIPKKDCHMGAMDEATARRVPAAVWKIMGGLAR
jgi:hypothetical protein